MKNFIQKNIKKILILFTVLICGLLWLWFYETRFIKVEEQQIDTGFTSKFVLVSDMHLGFLKQAGFLQDVVNKINEQENVEFVVLAGDFIYSNMPVQTQEYYDELLAPVKNIKYPVIVVFGNHENGASDPDVTDKLQSSLEKYGANVIENEELTINGKHIVGLTDYWENPEAYKYLDTINEPIDIVVTHNPDLVDLYSKSVGLTVSGHTHCGQIRIPIIYKYMLPISSDYEKGLYDTKNGKLFVSCGVGETGIPPFRLWNRPSIYLVETK